MSEKRTRQGPFDERTSEATEEPEAFGWTGVVALAIICSTVLGIVWIIWG